MADDDDEESAAGGEDVMEFPAVSRVTFDERTGTVTLKLATAEEIAEAEKMRKEE